VDRFLDHRFLALLLDLLLDLLLLLYLLLLPNVMYLHQ
jgi:hypothetical protein